jgi:hypothetical protein
MVTELAEMHTLIDTDALIKKAAETYNISENIVKNRLFSAFRLKSSRFFYKNDRFLTEEFTEVFMLYCMIYRYFYTSVYRINEGETATYRKVHESALRERLDYLFRHCLSLGTTNASTISDWVILEAFCSSSVKLPDDINALAGKYFPDRPDLFLALTYNKNIDRHPEADIFIGLMVPSKSTFMRHHQHLEYEPLAVCGIRGIDYKTAIIENLQGEKEIHLKWGEDPELKSLKKWPFLLVEAMESLAKMLGVEVLLFRCAENHLYRYNSMYSVDLKLRMNGTAKRMGYKKRYNAQDEPYYIKYLDSKADREEIDYILPRLRSEYDYY